MGNLLGGGNEGGDSSMMIVALGALMICCSSSAVLGYGWYENWFCDTNSSLGKSCPDSGDGGDAADDGTGDLDTDTGTTAPSGDTGDSGTTGDSSSKDSKEKDKGGKCKEVKVQLGYLPAYSSYSGSAEKVDLYDAKGGVQKKGVSLKSDFVKACKSQYYCDIDKGAPSGVSAGLYLHKADKQLQRAPKSYPTTSKGDQLKKGYMGVNAKGSLSGYKSITLKGKPYSIKDECGDCDKCEVSIYTGMNKKPSSSYKLNGLKDGDKVKVEKSSK